jgi:uncharacterized protein YkwD
MIYYRKTLFGSGPKLTEVHNGLNILMNIVHFISRIFIPCGLFMLFSGIVFSQSPSDDPTEVLLNNLSQQAFERINQRRAEIGLPPFVLNHELQVSALAHANYIVLNNSLNTEMHNETTGKLGFTGIDPDSRMRKAGYIFNGTSENIAMTNYPDGSVPTDNLIDAPYHRQAQFSTYMDAGNAIKSKATTGNSGNKYEYIYVINFGNPAPINDLKKIITYPAAGQKNAKIDWIVNEVPSPWPERDGQRVGYPISIGVGPSIDLLVKSFSVIDVSASSSAVEGRLVINENGKRMKNFAFWIPSKPLNYSTNYQAHVVGLINGEKLDYKWQFSTLPKVPLILTASTMTLNNMPGSSITIRMTGGTNNDYKINEITESWQVTGHVNSANNSFVHMMHPSPDTVLIYRNTTPCEGYISACVARVSGTDSSGTKASIELIVR